MESNFEKLNIPIHITGFQIAAKVKLPLKLYWIILTPITLFKILRILKRTNPNVVITSLYQSDILGILAAKLMGISNRIFIQHDVVSLSWLQKSVKKIICTRWATKVIAVSNPVKEYITKEFKIPSTRIVVINNGIDTELLKEGKRMMSGQPVIGMVGRLESVKGPDVLLKALNILKKKHNIEPAVVLGGGGSMYSSLESYAHEHQLRKVNFLGPVAHPLEVLKQVDVLVIPSLSEGFGLVALEGLVAGKAVIASDFPALRELIHHKKNGLLFPVGDYERLANIIYELSTNKSFLEDIQNGVQDWIISEGKKFDINNTALAYQNIFLSDISAKS